MRTVVFGYGSLVDRRSATETLGRPIEMVWPARLSGWRRRFSLARDNVRSEKTFARTADGWVPPTVLALNLERDSERTASPPNGALIEVYPGELDRLDRRELRYDRIDVTNQVTGDVDLAMWHVGRVFTYVAMTEHLAVQPPSEAVVLASYLAAVESAFDRLGGGELRTYRQTTGPAPVEVMNGVLVGDAIPQGNPRDW